MLSARLDSTMTAENQSMFGNSNNSSKSLVGGRVGTWAGASVCGEGCRGA